MSLDDPIVAEVLADLAPAVQPAPAATGLPSRFACFVTGTDTEIGKTLTSSALLHALVARGVASQPQQPLGAFHQSGVELLLQLVLHVPAHTRTGDDPQQCYPRQQGPRQRPRQAARFHGLVLSL